MGCLQKRTQKEVDVACFPEYDFVEEVVSAAREPGHADEGGSAPGAVRLCGENRVVPWLGGAAGVDDVLANLDGEATFVHVGE